MGTDGLCRSRQVDRQTAVLVGHITSGDQAKTEFLGRLESLSVLDVHQESGDCSWGYHMLGVLTFVGGGCILPWSDVSSKSLYPVFLIRFLM